LRDTTTRERLLDAAEELFGLHGYDAVSVRDIAQRAGVNLAGVNYHFGGKENLYVEALRRRLAPRRERLLAAIAGAAEEARRSGDAEPLLRAFVRAHLGDVLTERPQANALRLTAREMVEQHHGARVLSEEMVRPVHEAFREALARALPSLDARRIDWIIGSVVGQVVHFIMRWRHQQGEGSCVHGDIFPPLAPDLETYVERTVEHIVRFSRAGIMALCDREAS